MIRFSWFVSFGRSTYESFLQRNSYLGPFAKEPGQIPNSVLYLINGRNERVVHILIELLSIDHS